MKFRHFFCWAVLAGALVSGLSLRAQFLPIGMGKPAAGGGAATGTCAASTAWLARVYAANGNANLSATTTLDDTMICGMVSDGVWAKMDAIWLPGGFSSQPVSNLNMLANTFPLTVHGAPAWAANAGYTGTASATPANYLDTGFNILSSGTTYTNTNAHVSVWIYNDLQSASAGVGIVLGAQATNNGTYFIPWYNDGDTYFTVNNTISAQAIAVLAHTIGSWVLNRCAGCSALGQLFRNGVSVTLSPTLGAATTAPSLSIYLLAGNVSGVATDGAGLQVAAVTVGGTVVGNPDTLCVGGTSCVSSLGSTPVTAANASGATGLVPRLCARLAAVHAGGTC
jgi:hypothetical protein